jgi:two-component system CheB/CheR fusion protein
LPAIVITGNGDVSMAVDAMKAGALDFTEKPVDPDELLGAVERALQLSKSTARRTAWHEDAARRIAGLTPRQRGIMEFLSSPVIPASASPPISASANGPSNTTAPRS